MADIGISWSVIVHRSNSDTVHQIAISYPQVSILRLCLLFENNLSFLEVVCHGIKESDL